MDKQLCLWSIFVAAMMGMFVGFTTGIFWQQSSPVPKGHVKARDIIHADSVVCKDHGGSRSITKYYDGLVIYCNDSFNVSNYYWE